MPLPARGPNQFGYRIAGRVGSTLGREERPPGRKGPRSRALARLRGPAAAPPLDPFDFRAATLPPIFRYADECAQTGRLWTKFVRTHDDGGTVRGMAETQKVPCPADDAFIR